MMLLALLLTLPVHASVTGCVTSPKVERKLLGNFKGTPLTLAIFNYDDPEMASTACVQLEYTFQKKKIATELSSYSVPEQNFDEARISNDRIVLIDSLDGRFEDIHSSLTQIHSLDLATGKLKMLSQSITSPAQEEQQGIAQLLKRGKLAEALKRIANVDRMPNGNTYITTSLFAEFTPLFLEALKKVSPKAERARLAQAYVQAWRGEETADLAMLLNEHEWYKDRQSLAANAALWNDLAYYLEQGKEYPLAIDILNWVVDVVPARSVAHLNLADALQTSNPSRAALHRYIYLAQLAAFRGKSIPSAGALKLDQTTTDRWLSFQELPHCLNFLTPKLVPSTVHSSNYRSERNFTVARVACYRGIPIDQGKQLTLHENGDLHMATLALEYEISGVRCAKGKEITLKDKDLFCWLAEDQKVKGVLLAARTQIKMTNDRLALFTPREAIDFKGYPLAAEKPAYVIISASQILQITLGRDLKANNVVWPAGTTLGFSWHTERELPTLEQFTPWSAELPSPIRYEGLLIKDHCYFGEDRRATNVVLAEDWHGPKGEFCEKGKRLNFTYYKNPGTGYCYDDPSTR